MNTQAIHDDNEYWREFYSSGRAPQFPSQFAIFVQSWLGAKRASMREFGCGNGRDSQFFHDMGHVVRASDQVVGPKLRELASTSARFDILEGDIVDTSAVAVGDSQCDIEVIYSRFFQHSIEAEPETFMLDNLSSTSPIGTLAFFEFRTDEDAEKPKIFDGHYRRFQTPESFVQKLSSSGFTTTYQVEGKAMAVYRDEDPVVARIVAERR